MQKPKRKAVRSAGRILPFTCIGLILLLCIVFAQYLKVKQDAVPAPVPDRAITTVPLNSFQRDMISRVDVSPLKEADYTLVVNDGQLYVLGDDTPVNTVLSDEIFACLGDLIAADTVTADVSDYRDRLSDFGLDPPEMTVRITTTTQQEHLITIGDKAPDSEYRYITLSGDDRLFLYGTALVSAFYYDYRLLRPIEQPRMPKERLAEFSMTDSDGNKRFSAKLANPPLPNHEALTTVSEPRFHMTYPYDYPMNSELFAPVLTAISNFVLGPRMAYDSPEARAEYRLDTPLAQLEIRLSDSPYFDVDASGAIVRISSDRTLYTFIVGEPVDDYTLYTLYDGAIYLCNRFSLAFVEHLVPPELLITKPFDFPVEALQSLQIASDHYALSPAAQTASLSGSAEGTADFTVLMNDVPISADAFTMLWESMAGIAFLGMLPDDFVPAGAEADITVITMDGEVRSISLSPFDALNYAVGVNGTYLHYVPMSRFTAILSAQ